MNNVAPTLPKFYSPRFAKLLREMQQSKSSPDFNIENTSVCRKPETVIENYERNTFSNAWLYWFWVLRREFVMACLTSFTASIAAITSTDFAMKIVETRIVNKETWLMACIFFGANVIWHVFAYFTDNLRNIAKTKVWLELNLLIAHKIRSKSALDKGGFTSGKLKVMLSSDTEDVSNFYNYFFRDIIPAVIHIGVIAPAAYVTAGIPGLIAMLVICLQIPFAGFMRKKSEMLRTAELDSKDKLATIIGEAFANIRIIRYLGWEKRLAAEIKFYMEKVLLFGAKCYGIMCVIYGMTHSWWMFATAALVISAKYLNPALSSVQIFGVSWMVILASRHLIYVASTIRAFVMASPCLLRINSFLHSKDSWLAEKEKHYGTLTSSKKVVKLTFQNIGFAKNNKTILNNINFTLDLNKKTALLGKIGSGKTTIFRLILGLEMPTSGKILVSFADGSECDLRSEDTVLILRKNLAWVAQENFIAHDSIEQNITMGGECSEESLWRAVELAEFSADIHTFTGKFSTEIGENGVNLSGGQQQRLCIARALLAERDYILFDDSLSAVDKKTEEAIMKNLYSSNKNFFLISHRVKELAEMEHILILEGGEIATQGTFLDLTENPDSLFNKILNAYADLETSYE